MDTMANVALPWPSLTMYYDVVEINIRYYTIIYFTILYYTTLYNEADHGADRLQDPEDKRELECRIARFHYPVSSRRFPETSLRTK